MNRGGKLLAFITLAAVGQLRMDPYAKARDTLQPQRTRVSLVAVEQRTYGWDCLSHQCHEYYLVTLQEPFQGVDARQPVLVSYSFKGGEAHPAREQLDKYRRWDMELRRSRECDSTWAHFLEHNQFQFVDLAVSTTLNPERQLPCFTMTIGSFAPIQE